MERKSSLKQVKEIMGINFIGPKELKIIEKRMGIYLPQIILNEPPELKYNIELLERKKEDYILILGVPFYKDKTPLTLIKMREHFGWDPNHSEPCFYNQDWYLNEAFSVEKSFNLEWYLVKKEVFVDQRGKSISEINSSIFLPSAVLCSYVFFCYYLVYSQTLWTHDFIWCSDKDINNDSVYVGRYSKLNNENKAGFEIHRHLSIKNTYSAITIYPNI
ncbi:MAG: hypothetical protein IPM32_16935 [Ignavibacteriae bacterium]|nr:hypothetical protein [Ignavibacteriota bacterium]